MSFKNSYSNSGKISAVMLAVAFALVSPALSAATSSGAAPVSTASTLSEPLKEIKNELAKNAFSMSMDLEYSSNMYKEGDSGKEASTSLTLSPKFSFNSDYAIVGEAIIEKLNTGTGDTTVSNTTVGLSIAGIELNDKTKLTHSIAAILPTNEEIRERDRLQGAGSLGTKILFDSPSISLIGGITLRRNVHEFNINADGSANIEYTLSERLDVEVPMTEKLSYTATGIYRTSWTYAGSQRNSFLFDTGLDYASSKVLILSVGTTNDASALKANGRDSNIAMYDDRTSVIRAGFTYKF